MERWGGTAWWKQESTSAKNMRHINKGNEFNESRLLLFCLYFYLFAWICMQRGSEQQSYVSSKLNSKVCENVLLDKLAQIVEAV